MQNVYMKFLLIKYDGDLDDTIIDFFKSFFGQRTYFEKRKNILIVKYDNKEEYDIKEITHSLNQEVLSDIYIYDSLIPSKNIDEIIDLVFESFSSITSINKYFNEKTLLKECIDIKYDQSLTLLALKKYKDDSIMHDLLKTFFECNLNTTKASKALFMHRNTLINKLDKFIYDTGFDVRNFNDAVLIYQILKK